MTRVFAFLELALNRLTFGEWGHVSRVNRILILIYFLWASIPLEGYNFLLDITQISSSSMRLQSVFFSDVLIASLFDIATFSFLAFGKLIIYLKLMLDLDKSTFIRTILSIVVFFVVFSLDFVLFVGGIILTIIYLPTDLGNAL
jgi:hypothetical protein